MIQKRALDQALVFESCCLLSCSDGQPLGLPLGHTTGHACNFCEPCLQQNVPTLCAAVAGAADDNHLAIFRNITQTIRQIAQGDEGSAGNMERSPLTWFAHIQNKAP